MSTSPHDRDPRPEPGPAGRLAHAARSRTGVVVLAVVVLVASIAGGAALAGAPRPTGDVAAATPSASAAQSDAAPASGSPAQSAPARATDPGAVTPAPASPPPATATPSPMPTATPATADGIPAAVLQARLDKLRAKLQIPGVSVAIIWADGRRWLGASGMRDIAARDPMTTGTGFALASVSKTITAAVVLQLVEEGKLRLDQRVAPLLPAFAMNPRITVRNLLDHTSGLPDFFLNVKINKQLLADKNATWTAQRTWAFVPAKRPSPGRYWIYSNSNYLLLGELVTAITGRPLATEIRDRILDPLGLETGWYQGVEEPRVTGTQAYRLVAKAGGGVRAVPVAPESSVMPFRSVVTAASGAGSMAMTAADAARWMQAFAGGEVLGPDMQAQMLADVALTAKLKPRLPYGLGIQALPIAGRFALGHSGRFLGFRNVVRYLPGEGVTIAVLTNQGVRDPAKIAEALLNVVLPPLPKPSPSASVKP